MDACKTPAEKTHKSWFLRYITRIYSGFLPVVVWEIPRSFESSSPSNFRAQGSFIHINSGKIFERDLLSSDSVAKSATQKLWVFWDWYFCIWWKWKWLKCLSKIPMVWLHEKNGTISHRIKIVPHFAHFKGFLIIVVITTTKGKGLFQIAYIQGYHSKINCNEAVNGILLKSRKTVLILFLWKNVESFQTIDEDNHVIRTVFGVSKIFLLVSNKKSAIKKNKSTT